MSSTRTCAWRAISERLRQLLADEIADAFIGGTHTRRFADNLLPGLSQAQVAAVRAQVSLGSGNELRPTATGRRPAHAPYSSAALTANAFGRWLGSERQLRLAGLGGFTTRLTVEEKLKIAHGGGTANLDCVLQAEGVIVGVESKLTETLEPHGPVAWRAPYLSQGMSAMLERGWNTVFRASVEGSWQPAHLGA